MGSGGGKLGQEERNIEEKGNGGKEGERRRDKGCACFLQFNYGRVWRQRYQAQTHQPQLCKYNSVTPI